MSSNLLDSGDNELAIGDLGPLAWVLEELRKSLDGATKAMRRFVRDAEMARGADLTELDASHLRIARQQLDAINAAITSVVSGKFAVVSFNGQTFTRQNLDVLMRQRTDLAAQVDRGLASLEQRIAALHAQRCGVHKQIHPRWIVAARVNFYFRKILTQPLRQRFAASSIQIK